MKHKLTSSGVFSEFKFRGGQNESFIKILTFHLRYDVCMKKIGLKNLMETVHLLSDDLVYTNKQTNKKPLHTFSFVIQMWFKCLQTCSNEE